MKWFNKSSGSQQDEESSRRMALSLQSLEQGGLPLNAVDRLREQASRQNTPQHLFTSDLSVNELLLVRHAGYTALGQVMGSSIYHIGWQMTPIYSGSSTEMTTLTHAYYDARHLALGRMQQEAALLGATGVVGLRLERKQYSWGSDLLEFMAVGTAIRESEAPPASQSAPFLSDLSGEEFWLLRQGGYRPVGFVMGNCTYYQAATWRTQMATQGGIFGGSWNNQELSDFTFALYQARELAMDRMMLEARSLRADGIVGADVEMNMETREVDGSNTAGGGSRTDMIFHYSSIGTAIASYPVPAAPLSIRKVIPMNQQGEN